MRFLTLVFLLISVSYAYAAASCCANESLDLCGRICEPTCSCPNPVPPYSCPRLPCSNSTRGCRCNNGYLRNHRGQCVRPRDCRLRN